MAGVEYAPRPAMGPATAGVRAVGVLKSKIESLNRLGNMISEDIAGISQEIDRISGCQAVDPSEARPERPASCDLESMQEQLDRLDRLAQFIHGQLDRLRAI